MGIPKDEVSTLQLLQRVKHDLNELIDRRGQIHLIPALVQVQKTIDVEIHRP